MKRILFAVWLGAISAGLAADRPLGQLPDGQWYIKDEVEFCLKSEAARKLSPAGALRKKVETARLMALHPAMRRISGNHLSAESWLNGATLPARLQQVGDEVPAIARSLTATLTADADASTVVEELRKHPDIEWASLNLLHPATHVPNDNLWVYQWGPARIKATNAWDDANSFQVSVPVQPGNSGGPLMLLDGTVVGIVQMRLEPVETLLLSGSIPQNVNYAVKSDLIRKFLDSTPETKGKTKSVAITDSDRFDAAVESVTPSVVLVLAF